MCQNLHNILKQSKIDNDILGRFILLALCVLEVWDSSSLFSQHFFCLITVVYWRLIRGNSSYAKQLLNFHMTSLLSHLLQSWIADCYGLYISLPYRFAIMYDLIGVKAQIHNDHFLVSRRQKVELQICGDTKKFVFPFLLLFTQEVATKYEVKAMPTFLLIKEGAPVDKLVGANPDEIRKRIESLVQSTPAQLA